MVTSRMSHANASDAAAAHTTSAVLPYISGKTMANASRAMQHPITHDTVSGTAVSSEAFRSTVSAVAHEPKNGGQAQRATVNALTSSDDATAPTIRATTSADEQPNTKSRAASTLAALWRHEYSSSAMP